MSQPAPHRVALVTGGSRGIGLGITRRLLADGYAVAILATREAPQHVLAKLEEVAAAPDRIRYVRGNVADLADHARFLAAARGAWGRLDLLVNNAGVAPQQRADLLAATPESFDRVLDINLRGPYFLTQAFANAVLELTGAHEPRALSDPRATIVNVSSISARTVSTNRGDYCISKAGVAMATQLFAARLAPLGILVYEVRPGIIATDMTRGVTEKYDAHFAAGNVPIARWGTPDDIGAAVALLASGQLPYATGDTLHLDGGMHIPTL